MKKHFKALLVIAILFIFIFYFYFTDKIDVVSAIGISISTLAVGFFGEKFQRKIK
tara:strand:- start:765 stop:929 length:165 start_codon:yes stop_codon:yes gene_type:complete